MCTNENGIQQLYDEKFNQKFLVNGGVSIYFGNVFLPSESDKLPMIKNQLRKILVDFGMCQTCLEVNQSLNYIKVWYRDLEVEDLRGLLLQKYKNQIMEVRIDLHSCSAPKVPRPVKIYNGLTKLIYQEFISEPRSYSLVDNNPFNEIKTIIQKGNLAACVPLESIFRGELD